MESRPREIRLCERENGRVPFDDWILAVKDRKIRGIILRRLDRVEAGNFGDCGPVGAGVFELRIDSGPGYRVYFGEDGDLVVLLHGETKAPKTRTSKSPRISGGTTMPKRSRDYNSWRLEQLADPEIAEGYLNDALEDSPQTFLQALLNVTQARQVGIVAGQSGIKRETIYKGFSPTGNPTLNTLNSVLSTLGLKIQVAARTKRASRRRSGAPIDSPGTRPKTSRLQRSRK